MKLKVFLFFFLTLQNCSILFGQWMNPSTLQTTVLIEKVKNNGFETHGTGFLMYNYERDNKLIVVTCAHLVSRKKLLSIRVNPDSSLIAELSNKEKKGTLVDNILISENSVRILTNLDSTNLYIHPTLDIAAFYIEIPQLVKTTDTGAIPINAVNLVSIGRSQMKYRDGLNLGDEVYFIGFPLGYGVTQYVEPIVRSGSIAWLPKDFNFFLLDAFSYGGNSGSPIFQKVIVGSEPGSLKWSEAKLMGMVVGHQSIELKNILNQPNPDELKFEVTDMDLNIGLARCIYSDDIMFTVNELNKKTEHNKK